MCGGGLVGGKRVVVEKQSGQRQWQDPCYIWQKSTAMDGESEMSTPDERRRRVASGSCP